jgi:hypothetical protein
MTNLPKIRRQRPGCWLTSKTPGIDPGFSATTVKIVLDPVAEYLAALHLTAYCQQEDPDQRWQQFRQTVDDDPANVPTIRGFLLAVRNCCEQERKLPEGVLDWLNDRADFDPKAQKDALRRSVSTDGSIISTTLKMTTKASTCARPSRT